MPGRAEAALQSVISVKACCIGCSALPLGQALDGGHAGAVQRRRQRVQLFTDTPSTCTTQAPHWLVSQPTCVPVSRGSPATARTRARWATSTETALAVEREIDLHGFDSPDHCSDRQASSTRALGRPGGDTTSPTSNGIVEELTFRNIGDKLLSPIVSSMTLTKIPDTRLRGSALGRRSTGFGDCRHRGGADGCRRAAPPDRCGPCRSRCASAPSGTTMSPASGALTKTRRR